MYSQNSPEMFRDPTGKFVFIVGGFLIAAAIVGGVSATMYVI